MANDAGVDRFLPVHHQTFTLGGEPYLEPVERIVAAAGSEPERVVLHYIGEEFRAIGKLRATSRELNRSVARNPSHLLVRSS